MGTPERIQNPFSTILDSVFGSEASVRIVRELVTAEAPLGRAEIARRSGLSLPGVGYAVEKLYTAGVVDYVGGGTRQSVQIRDKHPLIGHLGMLFFVERSYGETIIERLRTAVAQVKPPPTAAWIEAGRGPAPAVLTILVRARDVAATREQLMRPLAELEADLDMTVEARVLTEADAQTADEETTRAWESATPVYGPGPIGIAATRTREGRRTHQAQDAASLRRGVWIARRLKHDPTLLKRAREWLVTHLPEVSPHEAHELQEWLRVLDGHSVVRVQHLLTDPGERGKRLRQSNPFIHALSERERAEMRKQVAL